jgi:hypothetical protein
LPAFSTIPELKAKVAQPSIQVFPTKGNSNKNVKKNEHNFDKREVLKPMLLKFKLYKMNSNH